MMYNNAARGRHSFRTLSLPYSGTFVGMPYFYLFGMDFASSQGCSAQIRLSYRNVLFWGGGLTSRLD